MAKKAKKAMSSTKRPQPAMSSTGKDAGKKEKNVPVTKQTAGGVTGAVIGAIVAGPVGALAGGVTGAMVGDAQAKGKRPIRRAVDAISAEIHEAHIGDKIKSVAVSMTTKIKSLRGKKSKAAPTKKKSAPAVAATAKKSKSKPAKKKTATAKKKAVATPKKKKAKKKAGR